MASTTGMSFVLNILRFRGHSSHEATEALLKVLYYSLHSIQDSCKRFLCPECYINLQSNSENVFAQGSQASSLGHGQQYEHVKYQIRIGSWVKADKGIDMCTKKYITSESMNTPQRTSHTIQGIDMSPHPKPKPKRRENPYAPEIPEQAPLPGLPVPAFPDVAIPIVPELPLPEVPEIPMPQEPGKAPKKKPSPGEPYIPDSRRICSTVVAQLESPMKFPLGHKETAEYMLKSSMKDIISKFNCNLCQKYKLPHECMTPLMLRAMVLRNRNNEPQSKRNGDKMFSISSELPPPTQVLDILSIQKYQKHVRTRINTFSYRNYVFGMTYEQLKQLYGYVIKLQSQVNHPKVLLNRFNYLPKR